jgi:Zn-dependent protease with chaperone function
MRFLSLTLALTLATSALASHLAICYADTVSSNPTTAKISLYEQPHRLSKVEAVALIKESLGKANFFNLLDYNESGKTWVEGFYSKIDLKDPTRYLGMQDQSKLYSIRIDIVANEEHFLKFSVTAKNESLVGRKYAETVKAKFEQEFFKRLAGFDKLRAEDPTILATAYLAGQSLVSNYGYTTLKLVGLDYAEPKTWGNYRKTLNFLRKECPQKASCQTLGQDIVAKPEFWELLADEAKKDALTLEEISPWVSESNPNYTRYLALLNESTDYIERPLEDLSLSHFENEALPEEWKAKGVGSEKARTLEKAYAFRSYDYYKRTNAFDVDTEEVLRVRRIAQKLFPYALRKGLDYKIHIYDDTKPGTGEKYNAFTSGGGILYFSRSLLQRIDPQDEAAIAAVVAHELGHNEAYHIQRQIMRVEVANAIVQLSQVGDLFVPGVSDATALTSLLILKGASRSDESEADRLGLYLLYKAGYEPQAMERVMETLYKMSGNRFTSLMDSHPAPPARKKRIHYLISHREVLEKTTPMNASEEFDEK